MSYLPSMTVSLEKSVFIAHQKQLFKDNAFRVHKVDKFFYAAVSFSDAKFAISAFQEDAADTKSKSGLKFQLDM